MPENNGKQNRDESYTNKYQNNVACSCVYKLVYVDNKFSKSSKSYLGEDPVYNFINSMVEESCSEVMKKSFNKKLVMTKEDDEDFENSTKCCICDNTCADVDLKLRDHCRITGKYRLCA